MNAISYNFGLTGQPETEFDHFLCGKRCRKRRTERRKLRDERRSLKNDQRRAETERLRTETNLLQSNLDNSPSSPASIPPTVSSKEQSSAPIQIKGETETPQSNNPSQASNSRSSIPLIAGSVLALGGLLFLVLRMRATK